MRDEPLDAVYHENKKGTIGMQAELVKLTNVVELWFSVGSSHTEDSGQGGAD